MTDSRLLIVLIYMCHFLASVWIYIGLYNYNNYNTGWMVRTGKSSELNIDPNSEYVAAFYFILTTLSTVGYGDIVGTENIEYIYQILVLVRHIFCD